MKELLADALKKNPQLHKSVCIVENKLAAVIDGFFYFFTATKFNRYFVGIELRLIRIKSRNRGPQNTAMI